MEPGLSRGPGVEVDLMDKRTQIVQAQIGTDPAYGSITPPLYTVTSARNPNVPKEEEDKAFQGELPEEEDTLHLHQDGGGRKTQSNQVPAPSNLRRTNIRTTPPTTMLLIRKKKRFRETSKEESSWLVYSSYSNHELLRGVFSLFQGGYSAGAPDFVYSYEQGQSECLV